MVMFKNTTFPGSFQSFVSGFAIYPVEINYHLRIRITTPPVYRSSLFGHYWLLLAIHAQIQWTLQQYAFHCLCATAVHLLKNKDGIVIVFMISLCWSSELHRATKTTEMLDGSQRGRLSVVQEQSCPTWYRETEYNGVTRLHSDSTLVVSTSFLFL